MRSRRLVLLALLALMQGCGGGGNGNSGDAGGGVVVPTAPGAFSASVRFDGATQRFIASWNTAQGAQTYRVQLKRDEVTDFAPLSGAENLSSATQDFGFAVGLTIQWSTAAVRVEACNTVGCTAAADLPLLPHLADALVSKAVLNVPENADGPQVASSADGNTLVVGTSLEGAGVVYVFRRTGTTWAAQPALVRAPNGEDGSTPAAQGDHFGESVALSADGATLIVGAPREDGSETSTIENENNAAPDAGAVYIFVRNAATYELQTYLKPTPGLFDTSIAGDWFGSAVAIAADGQTLVVGARLAQTALRPAAFDEGAAYVFTREGAAWAQRALLGGPHTDGNELDEFGYTLAISADGSTIAVGAPFDDGDVSSTFENPNTNASSAGTAYIFTTTDRVQWSRQSYLKAPNAESQDAFGIAVALSPDGNALAIGAFGEDGDATSTLENGNDNHESAGAVYVYTRGDAGWSTTPAYLKASTTLERAEFGSGLSLTLQGNVLAIGAPFDGGVPAFEGAVFVFVKVGASWLEQVRLDGAALEFGNTVALTPDGATLFIGGLSSTGSTDGAAHVY
jgi:hypothetical protein